jgi:hypothetical protein
MKFPFKLLLLSVFILCSAGLFGRQNPRLSFLKSAILPGWGELSNNHKSGYAFIASEVMFWFSKYYLINESKQYEQASVLHAVKFAHINPEMNFDDVYYDNLRRYLSYGYDSGGYNANVVMQAKKLYPVNLQEQQNYIMENIYNDSFYWHWDSKDKQREYKIMRKRISEYSDYSKAVTGFIILNHLVSAFNSARISSKLKRIEFQATFENSSPGIVCQYSF